MEYGRCSVYSGNIIFERAIKETYLAALLVVLSSIELILSNFIKRRIIFPTNWLVTSTI